MNAQLAGDRFLDLPSLSAATKRAYRSDVDEFLRWLGDRDLESVDIRVLVEYVGWLGTARNGRGKLAPSSIARKVTAVRAFLRHALGASRVADARLAPKRPRPLPEAPQQR